MTEILAFITNLGILGDIIPYFILSFIVIAVYQPLYLRGKITLRMVSKFSFILLAFFSIIFVLLYETTIENLLLYIVLPLLTFMTGWLVMKCCDDPNIKLKRIIYVIVLACAIHAIFNTITNGGSANRVVIDYFTQEERSATGAGAINTFAMALLAYFFIVRSKIVKVLGIICVSIASIYSLLIGTRTQFIIMAITFLIILFLRIRESCPKQGTVKAVFILLMIVLICYMIYEKNLFGIADKLGETTLFARLGLETTKDSDIYRMEKYKEGIVFIFSHLIGGDKTVPYFHNMWLDIGRLAGFIPTLLMLIHSILIFKHVILIFRKKDIDFEVRYLLLSLYLGVFMNFFVEPILEGEYDLYLKFCLITGMSEFIYYNLGKFEKGNNFSGDTQESRRVILSVRQRRKICFRLR